MSLYEASFRVKYECPYREISERHPDLTRSGASGIPRL